MNQNLLIVDDESEILSWLTELFRYEFDREVGVYMAGSAMEAIRLLAKVRFDVVLTDIRMPGMDGITLFHHIKENWPRCKTVFLTGYRSFEDVYQVINNRDVKYVLKSEGDDRIMAAVRDFLVMSEDELEQERHQKEQENWLEEAKYWLKRELMDQLCTGNLPDNFDERLRALEIPLDVSRDMLLFLLRIEKDWKEDQMQERFLQEEELIGILKGNAPLKLTFYVHMLGNSQELLIIQPMENKETDWQMVAAISQGAVEYAQEQFHNLYQGTVSAVMAPEPVALPEIPQCLHQLKRTMLRDIGGTQEVILKMGTAEMPTGEQSLTDYTVWISSLRNLIEIRKKKEYFSLLGKYLAVMTQKSSRHDTHALEIYYSVSVFLLHFINENHLGEQMAFQIGLYKLTMADAHESWLDAAAYLTEVSEEIFSLLEANESSVANHALGRVITYIEGHLEEDLSLTTLADIGGFNASYLSRLFKQVQRETIGDFILHRRMELAKKLLADTGEKIQDIASKTGYLSPHSFARAFRNEVGISPTEYREMKK